MMKKKKSCFKIKVCSCKTTTNSLTCQAVFSGKLQNQKEDKKRKT